MKHEKESYAHEKHDDVNNEHEAMKMKTMTVTLMIILHEFLSTTQDQNYAGLHRTTQDYTGLHPATQHIAIATTI